MKKSFSGVEKSDLERAFEPEITSKEKNEIFAKLSRFTLYQLKDAVLELERHKKLSEKNRQYADKIPPACLGLSLEGV